MRKEKNTIKQRNQKKEKKMIKKIYYIITLILIMSTSSFSQINDCTKFNKLSKDYLKCQAENIKIKSNESGVTDGVNDFKSSKTLVDFFKKKKK